MTPKTRALAQVDERQKFIGGLEAFAEFYREHPDVPIPEGRHPFNIFTSDRHDFLNIVRAMGGGEKSALADWFFIRKTFGSIQLEVNIRRELICRKIVTGTRQVPRTVIPAHTEENVEWVCDEPLLANVVVAS